MTYIDARLLEMYREAHDAIGIPERWDRDAPIVTSILADAMEVRASLRAAEAPPARARPGLDEEGRPAWMERMAIPLNGLPDSVLARLDQLGPGFEGWGRDADWNWFIDVGGVRYLGTTRSRAISAALDARGGTP